MGVYSFLDSLEMRLFPGVSIKFETGAALIKLGLCLAFYLVFAEGFSFFVPFLTL